jgi:thioredoxin
MTFIAALSTFSIAPNLATDRNTVYLKNLSVMKKQFGSFQELISGSDLPILVDFYASWCGPCQMMAKNLDQVNQSMKQKVKIVKINTDKYPDLASKYQVQALPTLVLFNQGQPVDRVEGLLSAEQIVRRLQNLI